VAVSKGYAIHKNGGEITFDLLSKVKGQCCTRADETFQSSICAISDP
jgi:hypothetical protein